MKFLLVVFAGLLAFVAVTNADDAAIESYIAKLDDFFDCANQTAAGKNSTQLEAAFKLLQTSLEDLITSQTPPNELEAIYNETLRDAKIYFGEFTKTTNISESEIGALCQFPGFPADILKTNRSGNDDNEVANKTDKTDANAEDKSNTSDDSDDSDEIDGKEIGSNATDGKEKGSDEKDDKDKGKDEKDGKEIAQNDDTSDDSDDKDAKENAVDDQIDTSDGDEYIEPKEENQSETAANNNGTNATEVTK